MRAQFVNENLNEKFVEDSDPIKDLNIGFSKRVLRSATFKVLQFIADKGKEGASLTEIQYFIWTKIKGYSPQDFWKPSDYSYRVRFYGEKIKPQRQSRGYWTTQLYGSWGSGHRGILNKYCQKNAKGKWVLKRWPTYNEKLYRER